jgi:hypothetical protein
MEEEYPAVGNTAYKLGVKAHKDGLGYKDNPHLRYSYNWEQWRRGYIAQLTKEEKERNVRA